MSENEFVKEKIVKRKSVKYIVIILVIVLLLVGGVIGVKKYIVSESKTANIGFENIGELATQAAYCTEVNMTEASREFLGLDIPFTQSKYIYSYDFVIKAGFDFEKVKWREDNNKIIVTLPEVKVLSNQVVDGSFKVFHEEESIFRKITLEENNEAMENMKKSAMEKAIASGLYDNAKANAEAMLTCFFGSVYDMDTYEIEFIYE